MNNITAIGKFLDQPRLVGKFSKTVPAIMIGGAGLITAKNAKNTPKGERKNRVIKDVSAFAGTMSAALIATRGFKPLKINGLINNIDLKKLTQENTKLVDEFVSKTKLDEKTQTILNKAKTKVMTLPEVKTVFNEVSQKEGGKDFLRKLVPDPENVTSKEIFGEIKRLSLLGLIPVLGGIGGGIVGDKLTDKNWKEKVPNKIKEGAYQYLANIFLCNVGAGIALGILEKKGIKSKAGRAIGMVTGIVLTGIIGGSAIANLISKKVIDPILNKGKKSPEKQNGLYAERKPEPLDIGLHTDDIATVAVLSGLKWIEPALPILYSISGYRAGIGYRNGDKKCCAKQ